MTPKIYSSKFENRVGYQKINPNNISSISLNPYSNTEKESGQHQKKDLRTVGSRSKIREQPIMSKNNSIDPYEINRSFSPQNEAIQNTVDLLKKSPIKKQGSEIGMLRSSLRMSTTEMIPSFNDLQAQQEVSDKLLSSAIQNLQNENWEKKSQALLQLRTYLKFNPEIFQNANTHQMMLQLLKLGDSLRSSLCKHALLTIEESFKTLQRQLEQDADSTLNLLLKKSSDTNQFISDSAKSALESVCFNISEEKLLRNIIQNCDSKSDKVRSNIAACLVIYLTQMGSKLLQIPKESGDKLFAVITAYVNDSSPEVRSLTRSAIIKLETNNSPMTRQESEMLIRRHVQKEIHQRKIIDILDKGEESYSPNPIKDLNTSSNFSRASKRMNSSSSFKNQEAIGSPSKRNLKQMQSTNQNQGSNYRKVFNPNLPDKQISPDILPQMQSPPSVKQKFESRQSNRSQVQDQNQVIGGFNKDTKHSQIDKPQFSIKEMNAAQSQPSQEIDSLLALLQKQTGDQKKYALLNLAEATLTKKAILLSHPVFPEVLQTSILTPLESLYNTQGGTLKSSSLSSNLQEAEILQNILAEVSNTIDIISILKIVSGICPYLGSSNSQAKRNAENLLNRISQTFPPGDIAIAFADSLHSSASNSSVGAKTKFYLIEKINEMLPPMVKNNQQNKVKSDIFPAVNKLMEEYSAGRGKNLSQELKQSIEKLIKSCYYQMGESFIEQISSKQLSKVFEIINKEKKQLI